ncbi:MAG: hypothetical protein GY808_03530 [Gammaproteobacteria bacterium]|nr:hypothetical protein [Gammaproteobacteria bacterium]
MNKQKSLPQTFLMNLPIYSIFFILIQSCVITDKSKYQPELDFVPISDVIGVNEKILAISSIPSSARYYSDGKEETTTNYQDYKEVLNIEAVPLEQKINFGLVVRRTIWMGPFL